MASHDKWMPLDIGSYLGDTGHLTYDQHGPYLMLLMRYWKKGPLPDDDAALARLSHVPLDVWLAGMGPIIRSFFVLREDGLLHQKRADAEIEKRKRVGEARRTAGKAGLQKRWKHDASIGSEQEHIAIAISPDGEIDGNCQNLPSICKVQVQEESKKEHKASLYDAEASPELPGITPAPKPPAKPEPHAVWSEGLDILAWLSNRSLAIAKQRNLVAGLLVKCQDHALGDNDMLMDVLRTVNSMPPAKNPIAVIKSMITERGGAGLKNRPRLVIDNGDPHGIQTWARSLPGVKPTVDERDRAAGNWQAFGWVVDYVAGLVVEAAELPTPCRMDWSLLGDWLADGLEPEAIQSKITTAVAWCRRQPGGYQPPSSLKMFDTFVRGARRVA